MICATGNHGSGLHLQLTAGVGLVKKVPLVTKREITTSPDTFLPLEEAFACSKKEDPQARRIGPADDRILV
jgi:hypothetical protein